MIANSQRDEIANLIPKPMTKNIVAVQPNIHTAHDIDSHLLNVEPIDLKNKHSQQKNLGNHVVFEMWPISPFSHSLLHSL